MSQRPWRSGSRGPAPKPPPPPIGSPPGLSRSDYPPSLSLLEDVQAPSTYDSGLAASSGDQAAGGSVLNDHNAVPQSMGFYGPNTPEPQADRVVTTAKSPKAPPFPYQPAVPYVEPWRPETVPTIMPSTSKQAPPRPPPSLGQSLRSDDSRAKRSQSVRRHLTVYPRSSEVPVCPDQEQDVKTLPVSQPSSSANVRSTSTDAPMTQEQRTAFRREVHQTQTAQPLPVSGLPNPNMVRNINVAYYNYNKVTLDSLLQLRSHLHDFEKVNEKIAQSSILTYPPRKLEEVTDSSLFNILKYQVGYSDCSRIQEIPYGTPAQLDWHIKFIDGLLESLGDIAKSTGFYVLKADDNTWTTVQHVQYLKSQQQEQEHLDIRQHSSMDLCMPCTCFHRKLDPAYLKIKTRSDEWFCSGAEDMMCVYPEVEDLLKHDECAGPLPPPLSGMTEISTVTGKPMVKFSDLKNNSPHEGADLFRPRTRRICVAYAGRGYNCGSRGQHIDLGCPLGACCPNVHTKGAVVICKGFIMNPNEPDKRYCRLKTIDLGFGVYEEICINYHGFPEGFHGEVLSSPLNVHELTKVWNMRINGVAGALQGVLPESAINFRHRTREGWFERTLSFTNTFMNGNPCGRIATIGCGTPQFEDPVTHEVTMRLPPPLQGLPWPRHNTTDDGRRLKNMPIATDDKMQFFQFEVDPKRLPNGTFVNYYGHMTLVCTPQEALLCCYRMNVLPDEYVILVNCPEEDGSGYRLLDMTMSYVRSTNGEKWLLEQHNEILARSYQIGRNPEGTDITPKNKYIPFTVLTSSAQLHQAQQDRAEFTVSKEASSYDDREKNSRLNVENLASSADQRIRQTCVRAVELRQVRPEAKGPNLLPQITLTYQNNEHAIHPDTLEPIMGLTQLNTMHKQFIRKGTFQVDGSPVFITWNHMSEQQKSMHVLEFIQGTLYNRAVTNEINKQRGTGYSDPSAVTLRLRWVTMEDFWTLMGKAYYAHWNYTNAESQQAKQELKPLEPFLLWDHRALLNGRVLCWRPCQYDAHGNQFVQETYDDFVSKIRARMVQCEAKLKTDPDDNAERDLLEICHRLVRWTDLRERIFYPPLVSMFWYLGHPLDKVNYFLSMARVSAKHPSAVPWFYVKQWLDVSRWSDQEITQKTTCEAKANWSDPNAFYASIRNTTYRPRFDFFHESRDVVDGWRQMRHLREKSDDLWFAIWDSSIRSGGLFNGREREKFMARQLTDTGHKSDEWYMFSISKEPTREPVSKVVTVLFNMDIPIESAGERSVLMLGGRTEYWNPDQEYKPYQDRGQSSDWPHLFLPTASIELINQASEKWGGKLYQQYYPTTMMGADHESAYKNASAAAYRIMMSNPPLVLPGWLSAMINHHGSPLCKEGGNLYRLVPLSTTQLELLQITLVSEALVRRDLVYEDCHAEFSAEAREHNYFYNLNDHRYYHQLPDKYKMKIKSLLMNMPRLVMVRDLHSGYVRTPLNPRHDSAWNYKGLLFNDLGKSYDQEVATYMESEPPHMELWECRTADKRIAKIIMMMTQSYLAKGYGSDKDWLMNFSDMINDESLRRLNKNDFPYVDQREAARASDAWLEHMSHQAPPQDVRFSNDVQVRPISMESDEIPDTPKADTPRVKPCLHRDVGNIAKDEDPDLSEKKSTPDPTKSTPDPTESSSSSQTVKHELGEKDDDGRHKKSRPSSCDSRVSGSSKWSWTTGAVSSDNETNPMTDSEEAASRRGRSDGSERPVESPKRRRSESRRSHVKTEAEMYARMKKSEQKSRRLAESHKKLLSELAEARQSQNSAPVAPASSSTEVSADLAAAATAMTAPVDMEVSPHAEVRQESSSEEATVAAAREHFIGTPEGSGDWTGGEPPSESVSPLGAGVGWIEESSLMGTLQTPATTTPTFQDTPEMLQYIRQQIKEQVDKYLEYITSTGDIPESVSLAASDLYIGNPNVESEDHLTLGHFIVPEDPTDPVRRLMSCIMVLLTLTNERTEAITKNRPMECVHALNDQLNCQTELLLELLVGLYNDPDNTSLEQLFFWGATVEFIPKIGSEGYNATNGRTRDALDYFWNKHQTDCYHKLQLPDRDDTHLSKHQIGMHVRFMQLSRNVFKYAKNKIRSKSRRRIHAESEVLAPTSSSSLGVNP